MIRRTGPGRFAWLFFAAIQLLVPTLWSVSDARADAMSAQTTRMHVEAPGTSGCPLVHPADCVVCRVCSAASAPPPQLDSGVPCVPAIAPPPADAAPLGCSARAPGDPPQRAPPR